MEKIKNVNITQNTTIFIYAQEKSMPTGNIINGYVHLPGIAPVPIANPNAGTIALPGGGIGVITPHGTVITFGQIK
jgi:hypothetical protein